jgi:hypothetical protein
MVEQYAVSVTRFYMTEADERSKKNPGHGYPAERVEYKELIVFEDKEKFNNWVIRNQDTKFEAWKVLPLDVIITPTVKTSYK